MTDVEYIVDCDIHPHVVGGVEPLLPYMTEGWQARLEPRKKAEIQSSSTMAFRSPHFLGAGATRRDAVTPDGGFPGSDPQFAIEDLLDKHHIDAGVLLPMQPTFMERHLDPAEAAVIVSAYNDYFHDHWALADPRFHLAIVTAPQDPTTAAAEIRRMADKERVIGIYQPTLNVLLGNRYYWPLLDAAVECELPIILHANGSQGHFQGSATFAGGLPTTQAERNTSLVQMGIAHLSSLIWEGTFERYPTLKVAFVEYGWTWVPSLLWRMDYVWKSARAANPWVKRAPSDYVRTNVRFTTQPGADIPREDWALQIAEQMSGEETLMFATDYPHYDADEPHQMFTRAPDDFRRRVFWQSACETFGARLQLPQRAAT